MDGYCWDFLQALLASLWRVVPGRNQLRPKYVKFKYVRSAVLNVISMSFNLVLKYINLPWFTNSYIMRWIVSCPLALVGKT